MNDDDKYDVLEIRIRWKEDLSVDTSAGFLYFTIIYEYKSIYVFFIIDRLV